MASFQAKTGWERQRKSEKKKNLSFRSVPTQPITKNSKKNSKKIKKTPLWLLFKPKQVGKAREREKIKIIIPISSYPTTYKEFKKIAKKFKKLKNTIMASIEVKAGGESPRQSEKKIIVSISTNPTRYKEFKNNQQKDSKN